MGTGEIHMSRLRRGPRAKQNMEKDSQLWPHPSRIITLFQWGIHRHRDGPPGWRRFHALADEVGVGRRRTEG